MKKFLVCISLAVLISSCGPIKTIPTATLELSAGGNDNARYSFEDNTSQGFVLNQDGYNDSFSGMTVTDFRSYKGTKSLMLFGTFTGAAPYASGIIKLTGTAEALTGKTLTAAVWVPKASFVSTPANAYGANFYLKTNTYKWYQSPWVNLTLAGDVANGVWCVITAKVDDMVYANDGSAITSADSSNVAEWGLKIGQGTGSANFTGYFYVDSIDVR